MEGSGLSSNLSLMHVSFKQWFFTGRARCIWKAYYWWTESWWYRYLICCGKWGSLVISWSFAASYALWIEFYINFSYLWFLFKYFWRALFYGELNQLNPCKDIECCLPNQYYFSSFELETDLLQGHCFLNERGLLML